MYFLPLLASLSLFVLDATCFSWPNGWSRGNPRYHGANNPAPRAVGSESSGWGGNIYNNRWATNNSAVTASSAQSLSQHCRLIYNLGVSATPVVRGDTVYYPTWDGQFVALNYKTCVVQWNISVTDIITSYVPLSPTQQAVVLSASRTSPQVDGDILYFATLANALLVAVNRNTGALLATIQINAHPLAVITMSPTVYNGRIFIGTSSQEEAAPLVVPGYACCSFIGNFAAVDFNRASSQFTIAWNVDMLPANEGWSGAAIWGSQPSIDISRSQVFIATGNVYNLPEEYEACLNETANITVIAQGRVPSTCIPRNVLTEAVIALDIETGLINWVRLLTPLDAWQLACGFTANEGAPSLPRDPALCPFTPGPDADFAMAPTFVPGSLATPYGRDIVVIGQKNGEIHALSAQAGTPFWSTVTSPTGVSGGIMWGIAVDDTRAYFTAVNSDLRPFTLQPGNTTTITNSAFGAVSILDGSIIWETVTPQNQTSFVPPSVVNDVVLSGRSGVVTGLFLLSAGGLDVLDKATGALLRDYDLDATFQGGIAIQDQYVMFGTGYYNWNGTGSFNVWTVNSELCYGRSCGQ